MQEPELQPIALDAFDAVGVDAAPPDRRADFVQDRASGHGMDADAGIPDLRPYGGIERAASQHARPADMIGQHDIVHREPADCDGVDQVRSPSSARRRSMKQGPTADR